MRGPLLIALTLIAGGGCGSSCNTDPPFPDDSCFEPDTYTLTELDIGAGEDELFVPLPDNEIRPIVYGPQGGSMVTVTLGMRGADVPACVAQATTLIPVSGGELRGSEEQPKRTYLQEDGSYTTRYLYIQFWDLYPGDSVRVHTEAGGLTDEVLIFLDSIGSADASVPDGGIDGMIDAAPDAT
jgi:hypothetical protein